MSDLDGVVALIAGASRGVGRGIAVALADAGARVYATGRHISDAELPGIVAMTCDHTVDSAVDEVFERIDYDAGHLDILVNSVWDGYARMVEGDRFTWSDPFWQQPRWRWDAMMTAGVRSAFVASQLAAQRMIRARRGLIVNVSSWAAQKYIGNVLYGAAKAATDKMSADMAVDLREYGVTVVSLYPGLVRTEAVLAAGVFDLSNSESPQFLGRVIAALASDPLSLRLSGQVVVAAALAQEYGVTDVGGNQPTPLTLADV